MTKSDVHHAACFFAAPLGCSRRPGPSRAGEENIDVCFQWDMLDSESYGMTPEFENKIKKIISLYACPYKEQ